MSVSKKVKALLNLTDRSDEGLADYLQIERQSLRNKYNRNSFSADDLVKIAEYCGAELSYTAKKGQKIVLDIDDARKSTEPGEK
jgi:hypothetical protein